MDINLNITEDYYNTLMTMTVDPKVNFQDLKYHSVVKGDNSFGIFWFKEPFKKDNQFFVKAECRIKVRTKEEANTIMKVFKKYMHSHGVEMKSHN